MRSFTAIAACLLLPSACGEPDDTTSPPPIAAGEAAAPAQPAAIADPPAPPPPAASKPPQGEAAGWNMEATAGGALMTLRQGSGAPALRLFCPARRSELLVNVPAFRPIGSEERLSFGGGGKAIALVADTSGDAQRGGVSGTRAVPRNLAALLAGELSASYGAQASGPHPPPPPNVSQPFVAACYKRLSVPPAPPPGEPPAATVSLGPCMVQDKEALRVAPLRAVGTEPFWAARINGRCVTYSDPEDQLGKRVWTRYAPAAGGGATWSGALAGKRFELRTRPRPGCSDGMSDKRYPLAVELLVDGERRRGCAEPE